MPQSKSKQNIEIFLKKVRICAKAYDLQAQLVSCQTSLSQHFGK